MIVGNGLLAKAFCSDFAIENNLIIFASGVSNSREIAPEQFSREKEMLNQAMACDKLLLYFSTCSISDPALADSKYVQHKREMENILMAHAKRKAIFRLPQVVGNTPNPNTLTNYLCGKIVSGSKFQVWSNARRNLIDVDDVAAIVTHLVKKQLVEGKITNVACAHSIGILNLVNIFEDVLGATANYELIPAGGACNINTDEAEDAAAKIGLEFPLNYIPCLIRKYYSDQRSIEQEKNILVSSLKS